jgi:hypothetical protein
MRHARCIGLAAAAFVASWALGASAQEVVPELAAVAPAEWSLFEVALREMGAPGVVAAVAFWLTRSLSGWTPTIRVIHVHRGKPEPDHEHTDHGE